MTLDELKARRKELQARKQEELERQARGEGDNLALFMVAEELLEVKAQIRALTPSKRIGAKKVAGTDYSLDRKQFQNWLEEDQDSSEDGAPDTHTILQGVLAEGQSLMTERQWEVFQLWASGMTVTEISRRLGIHYSAISRTLGRAKAQLQKTATLRDAVKYGSDELVLDMSDPVAFKTVMSCVTETQIVYLYLYFGEYLSSMDIAMLLERDRSSVSRTLHRGLEGIGRAFGASCITLENMDVVGEVAYQFYIANNDLDDPPERPDTGPNYWGRLILRSRSCDIPVTPPDACTSDAPGPESEVRREAIEVPKRYHYRISLPTLSQLPQSAPTGPRGGYLPHFGKLVSALLERQRRHPQHRASPIQYWLEQIFHGLSKWWGRGK